jgi:hypothetical protein
LNCSNQAIKQSITQRQLLLETIRQWFVNPNNEVSTQHRRAISKKPRGLAVLFTTSFWSALLLIATPQFFVLDAAAQTVTDKLPPITISGSRAPVACAGEACIAVLADLARELSRAGPFRPSRPENPESFEVSQEEFCGKLAKKKPRNCKRTRPAIAGRDGFGGNGCGSSAFSRAAAFATNLAIDRSNSGRVNEPIIGFSFAASCNAHDVCYATQAAPQASCDNGFLTSMQGVCGDNAACLGAAARYHAAVASFGEGAYKDSGVALQCYNWHVDMDKAGCGAQKDGITEDEWAAVE